MSKSSKVMIIIVLAVIVLCAGTIGIVSVVKSHENGTTVTDASGNLVIDISSTTQTTTAPGQNLDKDIIGKWSDSSGMMGYEFFEDGTVNVTYVNLTVPIVNIPINGSSKGTYSIKDDVVTVNFSIYSGNIKRVYTAKVDETALMLTDHEDGKVISMMKDGTQAVVTTTAQNQTSSTANADTTQTTVKSNEPVEDTILGCWKSSDNNVEYTFLENQQVKIRFFGNGTSASFTGVYLLEKDTVTIQYSSNGNMVTNKYTYKISGLSMSMTNSNDDTTLFVKTAGEKESLLGKWMDSSGMSGFEFKEDGVVKVTYVNLTVPVVNIPINGTFDGTYSVEGNTVKVNYSIYSNAVSEEYYFDISGNSLTLTKVEDGDVSTYMKQ